MSGSRATTSQSRAPGDINMHGCVQGYTFLRALVFFFFYAMDYCWFVSHNDELNESHDSLAGSSATAS